MELKDLVGEHVLDAVDFETEKVGDKGYEEDSEVMRFRLDGVVYVAQEDPSDGYRSSMRDLLVVPDARMTNVFKSIRVVGSHRNSGEYGGEDDVLELRDLVTGEIVLEVGTHNTDDYYPSFVANFNPKNMKINK